MCHDITGDYHVIWGQGHGVRGHREEVQHAKLCEELTPLVTLGQGAAVLQVTGVEQHPVEAYPQRMNTQDIIPVITIYMYLHGKPAGSVPHLNMPF